MREFIQTVIFTNASLGAAPIISSVGKEPNDGLFKSRLTGSPWVGDTWGCLLAKLFFLSVSRARSRFYISLFFQAVRFFWLLMASLRTLTMLMIDFIECAWVAHVCANIAQARA